MLNLDNTYIAFAGLVLGFSFLIFVHELGHFAVAKFVGIKCTQFAIGFGQALFSYRKGIGLRIGSTESEYERRIKAYLANESGEETPESGNKQHENAAIDRATAALGLGETEYRLNWMPLGGYVKMLGQEDMDPTARSDDPRSFNAKSIGARFWVLSAGVIMNLIFGAIFLAIAFSPWLGVHFPAATVGGVVPSAPAANVYAQGHEGDPVYLGLQPGDVIVAVNGKPATDFMDLRLATALGHAGSEVKVEVRRAGVDGTLVYDILPRASRTDGLLSAGVQPGLTLDIFSVERDSDAAKAGVKPDMTITAINDRPITTFGQLMEGINATRGQPFTLRFEDKGFGRPTNRPYQAMPTVQTAFTPQALLAPGFDQPSNLLGLLPAVAVVEVSKDYPAEAAGVKTGDMIARAGGVSWPANVDQFAEQVVGADGNAVQLVVSRDGQTVNLGSVQPRGKIIGVRMAPVMDRPVIGQVLPGSPADKALAESLPGGSVIQSINGEPVASWDDVQRQMQAIALGDDATAIEMEVQLNLAGNKVETVSIPLDEPAQRQLAAARWFLPAGQFIPREDQALIKGKNPIDAVGIGIEKTHQFMLQTYVTLLRLFQGSVKMEHLRGPVGIVDEGTKIATRGLSYLLFFLGLISVNLAVINFLPIPIVDGGHIVFLAIEKIKGSPVSVRVQTYASLAGLLLIGFVFLTTLWYDVSRLGVTDWIANVIGG